MKARLLVSALTGAMFGVVGYLLLLCIGVEGAHWIAVFCGLLFYLLMFGFLLVYGKIMDKRYSEIEKSITSPVFYKTNGNLDLGNGKVKNCNIYFCEAGIVCAGLEDKPYSLDEILLADIEEYRFEDTRIIISTKDGRAYVITASDARAILNILKEKNWIA